MNSKRDNLSLGCAALANGTTAASIKTQNIVHYQIGGRSFAKAVTDNIALTALVQVPAVPLVSLAASQQSCFFVLIDAAGNVVLRQWSGNQLNVSTSVVAASNAAAYVPGFFEWPQEDTLYAIIGAFKVSTNASGAFVPGTTSQAAANQTVTYFNVAQDLGLPIPF